MHELWLLKHKDNWKMGGWVKFGNSVEVLFLLTDNINEKLCECVKVYFPGILYLRVS